MAIPKSTSTPRRKHDSRGGTPPGSPTVGRSPLSSPLSTRPLISSPSSQRFPNNQGSPSSPLADDREAGRRRWEAEQQRKADEQKRIESVKQQLDQGRREREEFGSMGHGRGGDQPRENTYDSYFPQQTTPPRQQHQPQRSEGEGGFAAMLSSAAAADDESDDEDYRPSTNNPTTGMRLPAPLPSAHSSPGRSSPSRSNVPFPEPKRSLSPPPVGSLQPKSPPPLYEGDRSHSAAGGGAGPARERVEYQPMSDRERRNSNRPQQANVAQAGSFDQNRHQHSQQQQQQPLLHYQPPSPQQPNPFANPPTQQIQARNPPGQLSVDTRNLSFQSSSSSSPFQGSPFSGALPSPALAWGPNEKTSMSPGDDAKARMEERVLIRGRDRGEDRSTKFWNRFSMVAHDSDKRRSTDAAWLKKEARRTRMQKVWGWVACLVILAAIGGGLAAYFLTRDPKAATDSGNVAGAFQTAATSGLGVNVAATTTTAANATKGTSTTKKATSAAATATVSPERKRQLLAFADPNAHASNEAWEHQFANLLAAGGAAALPPVRAAKSSEKRRLEPSVEDLD